MAVVKSLPVHHHSAGYFFFLFPLGSIEPILATLKIEYRLSRRCVCVCVWGGGGGGGGGAGDVFGGERMQPHKLQCCI